MVTVWVLEGGRGGFGRGKFYASAFNKHLFTIANNFMLKLDIGYVTYLVFFPVLHFSQFIICYLLTKYLVPRQLR